MASDNPASFPITLGKPSLRRRLEAYYSLVAPFIIEDAEEWRKRFDQIYEKFGGSIEGEQKLALKLRKKYGDTVVLRVVLSNRSFSSTSLNAPKSEVKLEAEESYELTADELRSNDTNFLSSKFKPIAALRLKIDPVIPDETAPILDNISKARSLLPLGDPLRFIAPERKQIRQPVKSKKVPLFDAIVSPYEKPGPFSVLWHCQMKRQRVRVLIRYVNCIRGTITGYLKAFDKHFNLILQDVDECYSPRSTTDLGNDGNFISNADIELKRRYDSGKLLNGKFFPIASKLRHCKHILVRGDNVVSVWKADDEKKSSKCLYQE